MSMNENSDRGVTINKGLAWTIGTALDSLSDAAKVDALFEINGV